VFSNLSPFAIERRELTNGQLFKRVGGCCTGILTPNSTMAETLAPLARGLQFVPWQAPLLVLTNQPGNDENSSNEIWVWINTYENTQLLMG